MVPPAITCIVSKIGKLKRFFWYIKVVGSKLIVFTFLFLFFGAGSVFADSILINEIMPHPTSSNKEWIELYNNSLLDIDTTHWIITELTSSGNVTPHNLPTVIIPTHLTCFYEFSSSVLNDSGDTVSLIDSAGAQIDSYTYTSSFLNKTFSRVPDENAWQTSMTDPTKSATNCNTLSPPSTPAPTSSSAPISTPTSAPTSSPVFSASGAPSQINSDQSFSVQINITLPSSPNTIYYLTGAFKKTGGTRYFGLTKKDSSWIQYGDDYLNKNKIVTNSDGVWSSVLEVRPDTDDTDYKGSGDYIFKVGRYTSSGSGPTWSNESAIKIVDTNNSPTTMPTATANTLNISSPTPTKKLASPSSKSYDASPFHSASVAGVETSASGSAKPSKGIEIKNQKQINPIVWIGLILIFAGAGTVGYIYHRKR